VESYVILFKVVGTIYKHDVAMLEQQGMSRTNEKAVITRIHLDTIQWVGKLVKTRQHFAKNQPMNKGVT
jgi:hypothetical protein